MQQPLRFATIGLGGYAHAHIKAVQWLAKENIATLVGVIALESDRRKHPLLVDELLDRDIVLYESVAHFMAAGAKHADVLMAAVGIHQHVPVSIAAMQAGLHVFCEKPVAATVQEVDRVIAAQQEFGRKIAIGFQYIPAHSIQELKSRICNGNLGRTISARLMCCWPRSENYYARNNWAGKLRIEDSWILDSPANNAHAHFLFNLLYLASNQPHRAASPAYLQAELYRVNRIESTDLVQMRFVTEGGTRCFVVLSHCGWQRIGPIMELQCENGRVTWQGDWGDAAISYHDGRKEKIVNGRHEEWRFEIVRDLALSILENRQPICTPELARPHTLAINAMHESCPGINSIPEAYIIEEESMEDYPPRQRALFRRIKDHDKIMHRSYEEGKFFSELELPWAQKTAAKEVIAKGYSFFPMNMGFSNLHRPAHL